MNKKMFKYPILLGSIALIAGLLLALVYNLTAPVIEKNKFERENAVIVEMFGSNITINNISTTLNDQEKTKGLNDVSKVISNGSTYYVYKITSADKFDAGLNSYVVAITSEGDIYKFTFTQAADDWGKKYSTNSYASSIAGKNELTVEADTVAGATLTGTAIVESINAAIAHVGRVK